MCVYIYIYTYLFSGAREPVRSPCLIPHGLSVSSHKPNSQRFKVWGPNPRFTAYSDLNTPYEAQNCQGLGPFPQIELFKPTLRSHSTLSPRNPPRVHDSHEQHKKGSSLSSPEEEAVPSAAATSAQRR